MKFVIALLMAGIGYAAFDPTARAVIMSQPVWLIITECVLVYLVCGIPAFLFASTEYVRNHNQARPDGQDIMMGVCAGLTWPFFGIVYTAHRGWQAFKIGSINNAIAAYGIKRRKNVDKNS